MCTVVEIGRTSPGTLLRPRPQCKFPAMLKSTSLGKKMAPRSNVIASMMLDFMILSPCRRQMLLPGRGPPLVEVSTKQITIALVDILLPWTMPRLGHHSYTTLTMEVAAIARWSPWLLGSNKSRCSLVAPTMEADGGHLDWTSDKMGDLLDTRGWWMWA